MMFKWLGGLIDSNEKELKRLQPMVNRINELEPAFEKLSDGELRAKSDEFKTQLYEATAGLSQQAKEVKEELKEAKQRLAQAQDEFQEKEETTEVKRLQSQVDQLEKEQRDQESRVLDGLLPEAFAAVREAARRTIGQRHFDVQLIGGIVLHQGKIAEMKTGEGKTLVATLPLYLNSLTGRGCHLATVNDYLARRDPYWMGPVYHALGMSVASIYPMQSPEEHSPARVYDPDYDSGESRWRHFRPIPRQEAYQADITYGTSSEFGFDYLRDNMVLELSQCVQRPLNYAIVDEVDNLLIDEARTPLIISGAAEETGDTYMAVDSVVSRMKMKVIPHEPVMPEEKEENAALEEQYDYIAYEKEHHAKATPRGQEKLARAFGMKTEDLFGGEGGGENRALDFEEMKKRNAILAIFRQSMAAHALYQRDRNYVVKDGQVIIVDEFTGRLMFGRRYSEGLHQAIEAKEHVKVQRESLTLATITVQNYFRMYQKLAGMTGTAVTEAEEFHKIYGLEVVIIPTHKPMIRDDFPDQIYKDEPGKFRAVVREITELHKQGRPVLVGTVSIEKSQVLGEMLMRKGIPHRILNAKEHTKEGEIIAQAGQLEAVTVATNMAGRGVDIILGGSRNGQGETEWLDKHNKVIELGGLHVIGTERHEARRIDNQLRGRAGRQGDPGSSRFYISLEDDIMRRFGGNRIKTVMNWAGLDEDTPIENNLLNRAISDVQKRVEGYHFDIRKHLVEYDDVVNKQRELIYDERKKILSGADLKANILSMVREEMQDIVSTNTEADHWDIEGITSEVATIFPLPPPLTATSLYQMQPQEIADKLIAQADTIYEQREKEIGSENMRLLERLVMLRVIDSLWIEHLTRMEEIRLEAGWQTLRQVKAVDAYKSQGYRQFQLLLSTIRHDVARTIYRVGIVRRQAPKPPPSPMAQAVSGRSQKKLTVKVAGGKVGRNDPCPCGSGRKYKKCCGK
jgi:preprotein translocase subunit SecA